MDEVYDEALSLRDILADNSEYINLLNHPKITEEEKQDMLAKAFGDSLSDTLGGFLKLVVKKGRFSDILKILDVFIGMVRKYKKIGVAYVTSATALDKPEQDEIEKKLLDTTAYESLIMNYDTDRELIGGLIIRLDDRVVDSSIRSKLEHMAKDLHEMVL